MLQLNDLWGCAYLVSSGAELHGLRVIGSGGKRSVFFLFDGGDAERLHQHFVTGRAVANVTIMKTTMNHLKDLLFNELRKETENENQSGNYRASAAG